MKSSPGGVWRGGVGGVRDRKLSYALFCERNVEGLMRECREQVRGREEEGTYDQI